MSLKVVEAMKSTTARVAVFDWFINAQV